MKRSPLRRTSPLRGSSRPLERRKPLNRGEGLKRSSDKRLPGTGRRGRPISPATPVQRRKAKAMGCIVCGPLHDDRVCGPVDPAHVIPRSLLVEGQDDPLAVVGLGRRLHERYDRRAEPWLDLLPHLELKAPRELGYAVERFGLIQTLRRVTNERDAG